MTEERTIQCTGCEMECDVIIRLADGKIVSVEGNDCPTGASYAVSQCKLMFAPAKIDFSSNEMVSNPKSPSS